MMWPLAGRSTSRTAHRGAVHAMPVVPALLIILAAAVLLLMM